MGRGLALRAVIALAIALAGLVTWLAAGGTGAAGARGGAVLASLDTMPVPTPPDEVSYVRDKAAAVKLGKALFWDMQAGSDGRTACATCHFNAGADNRSRNQVNPRGGSFEVKNPNEDLTPGDFPFHKLADPNDRNSAVVKDSANVSGSQGVMPSLFDGVTLGEPADDQTFATSDPTFNVHGTPVRRTTGRNSPSVINAVFNFRNFWDGRAQNDFNGVTPFGTRDTGARVGHVNPGGTVDQVAVSIKNSSLASQSVGPPGNPVEMSADGRTLSDIGHKLMSLRPLRTQIVSPSDSVLGADVDDSGRGIKTSYSDLVKAAFQTDWWNSPQPITAPNGRTYSLMEFNFPMFWGLAIQAYEATLVSDQTPADNFFRGDTSALSPAAQRGLTVFETKGDCTECHGGPAMTSATALDVAGDGLFELDKAGRWVDTGFVNIGVRPTTDDPGIGGKDPFDNPLAATRLQNPALTPEANEGAFKVPGLRNVELTAPYFHNGGDLTLRQVVDFYSRGGSFDNLEKSPDLAVLNLTDGEKDDLVEFLKSLTDPRVKNQSAPFDHPELYVPSGEQTDASGNVVTSGGRAVDCFRQVPATGSGGGAPLAPFPTFSGAPCDAAPDLHNPAPVPKPAPTPDPAPVSGPAPAAPPAPAAAPAAPAGGGAGAAVGAQKVTGTVARRQVRCVVPRLRGRTLGAARKLLKRAHCRMGNVIRPAARGGRLRVRTTQPKARTRRARNARVNVVLRAVRRH